MVNPASLENKKKQILANLNESDLKQYIILLTSNYYKAFKENNIDEFNYNLGLLKEVTEIYKDNYANIIGFVYYNLFLNANIILAETKTDSKIKLIEPFNYNLNESEEIEEELSHDIKAIFNKERIRERYNNEK